MGNATLNASTPLTLVDRGACPLCKSEETSVYLDFPVVPVHRCSICQFMFSTKLMSQEEIERYYREDFGSDRHRSGQVVNATVNALVLNRLLSEGALGPVRSVLDVGTGYGYFLHELRSRFGLHGVGVELSRQEAEHARQTLGLEVINLALSTSGLSKASFDLVTSFEVVEHIADPGQFLRELLDFVRPGGWLLVMTDNFESRVAHDLGAAFPKWIPHSHISHFGTATFEGAMTAEGCSLVRRMSYTPWELVLKSVLHRLRGSQAVPEHTFDLAHTLETEMKGKYQYFNLRRLLNRFWARATLANNLEGALMYCLVQKH